MSMTFCCPLRLRAGEPRKVIRAGGGSARSQLASAFSGPMWVRSPSRLVDARAVRRDFLHSDDATAQPRQQTVVILHFMGEEGHTNPALQFVVDLVRAVCIAVRLTLNVVRDCTVLQALSRQMRHTNLAVLEHLEQDAPFGFCGRSRCACVYACRCRVALELGIRLSYLNPL